MPESPAELAKLKDKDWLGLEFPPCEDIKLRLAVYPPDSRPAVNSQAQAFALFMGLEDPGTPGTSVLDAKGTSQLRQRLGECGRFTVVERGHPGAAQDEASLHGKRRQASLNGADFILELEVLDADPQKEAHSISGLGGALGANAIGVGSFGVSGKVAWCRVNVHMYDLSGNIVLDLTVDGTAQSKGVNLGGGLLGVFGGRLGGGGVQVSEESRASMLEALDVAIAKIVYKITASLQTAPWRGTVSAVSNGRVVIDAGRNLGLPAGRELTVFAKGETFWNEDSTEVLGESTHEIGIVRIADVRDRISFCDIVSGCDSVRRGDYVRLERIVN